MQIQHGDVLLKQVEQIPKGAVKKQHGKLVVAEGEATGHAHTITKDTASIWELNGVLYLELGDPAIIEHQEHKPIEIPAGIWEVGRVQEYDYIEEMARKVID